VAIGGVCCCQSKTFGAVWRKTSARQISATPFTTKTSSAKVNASAAARNGCVCGGTFTSTFLRPSRSCAIKADCIRISSELEGLFITGIAQKSEARVRMHRLQPCLCLFTNTVSSPPSWQTPRRSDPRTIAEITSNNVGRPRRDETVAKDNGRSTAIYLRGLKDHGGDGARCCTSGRSPNGGIAAISTAKSLSGSAASQNLQKTLASLLRFPISRFQTPLVKFHVNRLI
jgi:hypothetical protein